MQGENTDDQHTILPNDPTPPSVITPIQQPPKRTKYIVIALLSVIVLLAFVITTVLLILGAVGNKAMPKTTAQFSQETLRQFEKQYGYDITYDQDVALDKTYKFPAEYDINDCTANNTCPVHIEVYTDPALTHHASDAFIDTEFGERDNVVVKPGIATKARDRSKLLPDGQYEITYDDATPISTADQWGMYEAYYIVQRTNSNGVTLTRPKVTLFTVPTVSAPTVTAAVQNDGSVNFSWNPVDGAKEYYLLMHESYKNDSYRSSYSILAKTEKTSLNLAEFNGEKAQAQKVLSEKGDVLDIDAIDDTVKLNQNSQFSLTYLKTQDSLYDEKEYQPEAAYDPKANGLPDDVSFAVVAVNKQYSAVRYTDAESLLSQIPVSIAYNAHSYMYEKGSTYEKECLETHSRPKDQCYYDLMPITMADGRTALKPVLYDVNSVEPYKGREQFGETVVSYRIRDTLMTRQDIVTEDDIPLLKKQLAAANQRNLAAYGDVGTKDLDVIYSKIGEQLPEAPASKEPVPTPTKEEVAEQNPPQATPQNDTAQVAGVSIRVNGTIPLVKYIAKNMLEGKTTIRTSQYQAQDPSVSLLDAVYEAYYQNPYAQLAVGSDVRFITYTSGVEVKPSSSGKFSAQEIVSMHNKVQEIINSITKAGMSDTDKALAINAYLSKVGTYDRGALECVESDDSTCFTRFPHAWSPAGVLQYGTGVCESYTHAFKALADAAGVQSIAVAGTTSGSGTGHAWNKVYMDGKWQIVDATWNDGSFEKGGALTKYFGLSDANANRVESAQYIVDRFARLYAAP